MEGDRRQSLASRYSKKPEMLGMNDLVPTGGTSPLIPWGITEREKYKIPYKVELFCAAQAII